MAAEFQISRTSWFIWFQEFHLVFLFGILNKFQTHGLETPREEIAFTARSKIQSQSQIFRYGQSIFCLPHQPNFSSIFDLCLHLVSVVRVQTHWQKKLLPTNFPKKNLSRIPNFNIFIFYCSSSINFKFCYNNFFCMFVHNYLHVHFLSFLDNLFQMRLVTNLKEKQKEKICTIMFLGLQDAKGEFSLGYTRLNIHCLPKCSHS